MNKTGIEWADWSWNPVTGCTKVSPGCDNCYARRMARRQAGRNGYPASPHEFDVTFHKKRLQEPLDVKKPSRIFVCSMSDLLHPDLGIIDIHRVYDMMRATPEHTFIVCTKRPNRILYVLYKNSLPYFGSGHRLHYISNVWHLTSAENQEWFDKRVSKLLALRELAPWPVLGVSLEPLLGPIDLSAYIDRLDWVIVGGESGLGARPMHPDWVRSIRDQCQAARVPFLFKQWGAWGPKSHGARCDAPRRWGTINRAGEWFAGTTPWNGHDDDGHGEAVMVCVGKKAAGRILDGRTWDEFPDDKQAGVR